MAENFEDVLDQCIDRIAAGESIDNCIDSFPAYADELRSILGVAAAAQRTAASVQPRPEFKARLSYEIMAAAHDRKSAKPGWVLPGFLRIPRWATAAAVSLALLIVAGTGTVMASSDSLPGQTLYPVKLAAENVQLALTFSDVSKAKLYAELADKRAQEIAILLEQDETEHVGRAAERLADHLQRVGELAPSIQKPGDGQDSAKLERDLYQNAAKHLEQMESALNAAPDKAREDVSQAKNKVLDGYKAALDALGNKQGR